jgi:hypothetical protein
MLQPWPPSILVIALGVKQTLLGGYDLALGHLKMEQGTDLK